MNQKLKDFIKKFLPQSFFKWRRDQKLKVIINKINKQEILKYDANAFPKGINLIGPFSQDSGLGQSCRLLAKAIEKTNIPHNFINYRSLTENKKTNFEFEDKYTNEYKYSINIFHINALQFPDAFNSIGRDKFDKHYNIAYWLWETEDFPDIWVPLIDIFDEIWTPADFITNSIKKKTNKPVKTIPYIIEAPYNKEYDRKYFNLPEDKFLFLMMYDVYSVPERKNPDSVIEAYKKAFKNNNDVALIIKLSHGNNDVITNLKNKLEGCQNYIIEGTMPKEEINSLIKCADAYVSLHRSEGYGLVLAEAMKLGVPTIATNYSANTEFQNNDTALLVPYKLIKLNKEVFPYDKNTIWANPDIEEASKYMKLLYEDKDKYNSIKENALNYINDIKLEESILNKIETEFKNINEEL